MPTTERNVVSIAGLNAGKYTNKFSSCRLSSLPPLDGKGSIAFLLDFMLRVNCVTL